MRADWGNSPQWRSGFIPDTTRGAIITRNLNELP